MSTLDVRRIAYAVGAEIDGLDLTRPLDAGTVEEIRRALYEFGVVVFRNQDLDGARMQAFGSQFGDLDAYYDRPENNIPGTEGITIISNRPVNIGGKKTAGYSVADRWHTDGSYKATPTAFTFLTSRVLPEIGGNTMFANAQMAYDTLSPQFRQTIDGLHTIQDATLGTTATLNPEMRDHIARMNPPVLQALVMQHPVTGRKALYLGYRIRNIEGMTEEESRPILSFLERHVTRYEFIYRHVWQLHDVIIWDNRVVMHYAVRDYDPAQSRQMLRAALCGAQTGQEMRREALV